MHLNFEYIKMFRSQALKYVGLECDQEFERDPDLAHGETFEQLIFTIHKLKFTLVIIPVVNLARH